MSHRVKVNSGVERLVLTDGNEYDGGEAGVEVLLTDAQFAALSDHLFPDTLTDMGAEDDPGLADFVTEAELADAVAAGGGGGASAVFESYILLAQSSVSVDPSSGASAPVFASFLTAGSDFLFDTEDDPSLLIVVNHGIYMVRITSQWNIETGEVGSRSINGYLDGNSDMATLVAFSGLYVRDLVYVEPTPDPELPTPTDHHLIQAACCVGECAAGTRFIFRHANGDGVLPSTLASFTVGASRLL